MFASSLEFAFIAIVLCAIGLDAGGAQKDRKAERTEVHKGAIASNPPNEAADIAAKLKKLIKERVDTLSKAAQSAVTQYESGAADFGRVAGIQRAALKANLDLQGPGERLAALRKLEALTAASFKIAEAKFSGGLVPGIDVAQAKAVMLEVQIELLREELKAKGQR